MRSPLMFEQEDSVQTQFVVRAKAIADGPEAHAVVLANERAGEWVPFAVLPEEPGGNTGFPTFAQSAGDVGGIGGGIGFV